MALSAPKDAPGKKFAPQENLEPGNYPARLVQLIDLGLQAQRPYQGKDKPPAQEIMFTYELVDAFMLDEDGNELKDKPRWISETLPLRPLYQENATSTKRMKAFDPAEQFEGDFSKAVGGPVNVAIVNNTVGDKTYDNIGGIGTMRPRDSANCPELVNPVKVFDLDAPDMEVFASLPKWIQDKIKSNLNFAGSVLAEKLGKGEGKKAEAPKTKEPVKQEDPSEDDIPY